ncbi:hypothetical protein KL943_001488 [Ogataea angusta]|nr:hypothetical protein KL943_001488 [Ogataea angusta]
MSLGRDAQANLAGKTVLITGASAGIGEAIAHAFADAAGGDIRLVLAARRARRLEELGRQLARSGAKVHVAGLDVSDNVAIDGFFAALPSEFRDIDVLVNNAGTALGVEHAGSIRDDDVQSMFATNVLGLIKMTQTVVRGMKQRNRGDIVQLGSIAGIESYPGGSVYCATKAAVRSFTQAVRKELIGTRIRVMEVDPGAVETEFSLVRFGGDAARARKVRVATTGTEVRLAIENYTDENPRAAKRIMYRVVGLYVVAVFVLTLVVPIERQEERRERRNRISLAICDCLRESLHQGASPCGEYADSHLCVVRGKCKRRTRPGFCWREPGAIRKSLECGEWNAVLVPRKRTTGEVAKETYLRVLTLTTHL